MFKAKTILYYEMVNIATQPKNSNILNKMAQYQYYIDFNKLLKHMVIPVEITKENEKLYT